MSHARSKHIKVRCHFLIDQVNKRKFKLEYCKSEVWVDGILTKPLKKMQFNELKELVPKGIFVYRLTLEEDC